MGHFWPEELKQVLFKDVLMYVLILLCRATRFKGFRQQDSQELLRYLLDSIRNEEIKVLNPLSPNGDQHQFSPNNVHTLSRD